MARRIFKKNTKLNFLWRQNNYLNYFSRRLLCKSLIQSTELLRTSAYAIENQGDSFGKMEKSYKAM